MYAIRSYYVANGLFRIDNTVGLDLENQLVEIRTLLDAGALNAEADLFDRAV